MSAYRLATALGWEWLGQRDVGDMAPAWHDDYRTPDGRIINTEPPYWQNAVAHEIMRLRGIIEEAAAARDVAPPPSETLTFETCAECGHPIFESLTWNHCGGTPPQDHQAAPAPTGGEE